MPPQMYSWDFATPAMPTAGVLLQLQCLQQELDHSCNAYGRGSATVAVRTAGTLLQLQCCLLTDSHSSAQQSS